MKNMRSIETLVRSYPNKTGAEILEMQEQDKIQDQKDFERIHEKTVKMVEDYQQNGAYFKSTFGLNQYRFDRFFDLQLEDDGSVSCSVETIVAFYGKRTTIERRVKECQTLDVYAPQKRNRVSKDEFDAASQYLDKMFTTFWGLIENK